jgi:hypothetical protein
MNAKTKEEKRAAKFAATEALATTARKKILEEDRPRFRAEAVKNTAAGEPSVITCLKPLSVRQRKTQEQISKDGKPRILSKGELLQR